MANLLDSFVRWVYHSVDAVLVSCRGFRSILKKYSHAKIVYAPNWPLTPYVPGTDAGKRKEAPVFLFAGNVGKVQNLENVLIGYAAAFRENPGLGILRIVGDGSSLESLRLQSAAIGGRIEFPGRIPASEIGVEYDRADFLVLSLANQPVFRLTVPSKFQMYLTVGKPILCAAVGEVADMVRQRNLGIVADPDDPADIARAFLALRAAGIAEMGFWASSARRALADEFDRTDIHGTILRTVLSASRGRKGKGR
jgi:glycosyltransferase involved in cell wall biosynthesis